MRFQFLVIVAVAIGLGGLSACTPPGDPKEKRAEKKTPVKTVERELPGGERTPEDPAPTAPEGAPKSDDKSTPEKPPQNANELAGDCSEGLVIDAGIMGGKTVKAGSWIEKQTIFLYSPHIGACTGSIIAPDVILTAAHCVAKSAKGMTEATSTGIALFGANPKCNTSQVMQRIAFRDIIVHPNYTEKEKGSNDLALIRLQKVVPEGFSAGAVASSATFQKLLDSQTTFQTAGYGNTIGYKFEEKNFPRLRVVAMILMPQYGNGLTEDFAFDQKTGGFCAGDSGGPMFAKVDGKPSIVGVNSIVVSRTGADAEPCTDMSFSISIEASRSFLKRAFEEIAPNQKNPF